MSFLSDAELERGQRLSRERMIDRLVRTAATDARHKALKEGHDQGLKEGLVRCIHLCLRLMKVPVTPTAELQALTVEALEAKAKALEQQLGVA